MRALILLCLCWSSWLGFCPCVIADADDIAAEDYAFLEMATQRDTFFVQELIRVELRIGVDARFFAENAIQLFHRRLDVPVQLEASWLDDLPGAIVIDSDAGDDAGGARLTFALNDKVASARRIEDRLKEGRTFTMLQIDKSFLPLRPGKLEIPEPKLRFAFATRFTEDLVSGRVPEDRRDAVLSGEGLMLRIKPLPEEGRPLEFTGAVGRFSIDAEADPLDLEVGESLKLALRIEGEGNLQYFDPPRLDRLEGFHIYGSIDQKAALQRTVTFDLAPLTEEVQEVPPIGFAYFDTNPPARYRTIKTRSIPLKVRLLPEGARLEFLPGEARRFVPGENDIFDIKPVAALSRGKKKRSLSLALVAMVLLAPWLLALGLSLWLRARERDRTDPDGKRARGAAAAFRARIAQPDAVLADAFSEYLAARMRSSASAMITPDLVSRLTAAGVPAELAARAATLLNGLVAERYGSSVPAGGKETLEELVLVLEESFREREP
jgi:hypothetical protein